MLSILATLATTVALFLVRRLWPGPLTAWLSYLLVLGPNSGIIRIGQQIAADRYSYIATLPLMIVLAGCLLHFYATRMGPCFVAHHRRPGLTPGLDSPRERAVPNVARLEDPMDPRT